MKRYGKVFIMSLLSIFALAVPVFAREMTPDELGKEAKRQIPKTSYVYVIGEYAFTSEHDLTTQDVMLAARSIEAKDKSGKTNKEDIYNEMTIFQLKGKYNESVELTGWELDENVIGTTKLADLQNGKFNVRYIDYNYVKELYKVTLDLDDGELPEGKESSLDILEGEKINQADITGENRPTKAGKQFKEWVLVKEGDEQEKWDFNNPVTGNITLKATWYDEVNTDELLKEAESKMTENEWYSAKFDAESSKLIFTVLDRNEKNSLISGTGITGNIVAILQKANVKSITMGNTEFTAEDLKSGNGNPAGPDGTVWSKFGEELAQLTGKGSFEEVTLGDLVGQNLTLKITVDDDNARTHKGNTFETYTIEFVYNAKATIDTDIPENDVTELEKLKYTPETTYNIKLDSDGLYKVTGYITKQEGVQGFGDSPSGFYFAYTITLDEGIDAKKAKVKVPTDENGTKYNEATFDSNGQTTILMEVKEDEVGDSAKNYYRDIIIDVDGVPTKVRIDFKELELRKNSKTTLEKMSDDLDLSSFYGWEKSEDYDVTYEAVGDATTGKATIKVKGLLPIYDGDTEELPFEGDHATGYYIAFAIKTENEKVDNKTKVTITDGKETTEWTDKEFDGKDVIYILKHLHPEIDSRQFTVVVDMDGDDTGYNPYTITVDWSELKLQTDSEAKIALNKASQADKDQMTGWGYTTPAGQNVTLKDGMLTGKLVEQELTSKDAFGEDKKDGFYFDFTIQHPEGVEIDKDKVEITRVKSHTDIGEDLKGANVLKKFTGADLDVDNNLTILYRFPKDTKSCTECAGKDACDSSCCGESGVCDKVLYYVVDWDGAEGKEFLPVVYSIDYCGVTFERTSIFTVEALQESDKGEFGTDDKGAWFDTGHGYSVKVEQDKTDAKKYTVTGVLPIFDDSDEDYSDTFDTTKNLYYLGLLLKSNNKVTDGSEGEINVKFFHGEDEDKQFLKVTDHDFSSTGELYILKALVAVAEDGSPLTDDQKVFTITLDLDGEDGKDYTPYTVTIDWSGLKLQSTSAGNFGNYEVATETNIKDDKKAVQDLKDYGYNYETSKEVTVKTEEMPEHGTVKRGIEGKIKEQTLTKGTFDDDTGYFVPIKVEFPGKDDDSLSEYSRSWTIILNTEKGTTKTYTPTAEEYDQGWVLVLFKIDKDGNDGGKKISYKIDYDGEKFACLPEEYTIDYENLEFAEAHKVEFSGVDTSPITVWDGDTITEDMLPETEPTAMDEYHKFAYWNKEDGTKFDSIEFTYEADEAAGDKETGDITLVPHWNLYSDKFISDVLEDLNKTEDTQSGDFSKEFKIENYEENSGKVTITVLDPTVSLSRMNETSIPGTIAYILLKDEIKEITLSINGQEKTFKKGDETDKDSLKEQVINDAKELYGNILSEQFDGKDEDTVTLSDLAHKEGYNSFTLKFNADSLPKTLTLTKAPEESGISLASEVAVPTEYEFTFKSDAIVVNSEGDLTQALKTSAEHIYIGNDFSVNSPVVVDREVVINGGTDHHKLTASSGDTIFDVQSSNVTIDAIKLDAKTPIVVTSGSLTTTGLTVEGDKAETAVEVKKGASLTISELTFDREHYTRPAVKAEKEDTTVTFKNATKLEKIEKITTYEKQKQDSAIKNNIGDYKEEDTSYQYYNYYNKAENSKIYKTTFHSHEFSSKATFERYNYYGEKVTKPNTDDFKVFKSYSYDGYTYTLIGFAESRDDTLHFGDYTTETVPDGVTKVEDLVAKSDKLYYGAYNGKVDNDARRIEKGNAEELYNAIQEPSVSKIYITDTTDLDLTSKGPITINRPLSIVGPTQGVKIKVENIKIEASANDVFFHRLNIEANPKSDVTSLIDVAGEKFTLWQSSLKNVSEDKEVDSAIKYSGNKAIVDIRWNTFDGNKIKNTFIDVESKLAGVTDIYYNTFKNLTSSTVGKTSAIIIKQFDESAKISEENDETISIDFNTFNDSDYAIKILKDASSGPQADISIESSKEVVIAVEYDESHKDFSNINIHPKGKTSISNIKLKYISGNEEKDQLDGDTGVKVVTSMESIKVPEQAVVNGLKLNGDTYSGVISQSEDGNFYLPVTLTSNDFKDRVSTVKVIDPNGNAKTYTYGSNSKDGIATVSNANTMNLQLEAIKSSKITGNNGKVYKLELDADGDKSNDYKVKVYTINYSGVETLEEKINQAAQATLEANSFTVTKNNKINGYTEEFTYEYNANDGLTYLKAEKDNVEEYTFSSAKYAGADSSKLSVVARKIKDGEEDSGVYLNDWVYVHPQQVGRAIHEVTMLTDVMKDSKTSINAIDTVELVEGEEHKYTVKLNGDKYTDWVKNNYLLTSKYTISGWGETVLVDVELDENDKYIKSIKTHQESSSNTFDVTFTNVNDTTIKKPIEFLAKDGKELTEQDIKDFYEKGKQWWDKHIHENAYTQQ